MSSSKCYSYMKEKTSNSWFKLVKCISDKVYNDKAPQENDCTPTHPIAYVKCFCEFVFVIFCVVMSVPLSRLLINHYRMKQKETFMATMRVFVKDKKFWILFMCLFTCFTVGFQNFFYITNRILYQQGQILILMSHTIGVYVIIYYIFKKASKNKGISKDNQKWLNWRLKPLIFVSLLFNLVYVSFL